jgi:hypothetical protein
MRGVAVSSWTKIGGSWIRVDSISEIQFGLEPAAGAGKYEPVLRCVMNGLFSEDRGHAALEKAEQLEALFGIDIVGAHGELA